jgi:serine/threonine-protein kinase
MMYEMLTGEQPFKGEQPMQIAYQHANDSVPMPSAKNPKVPAELDELVLWATARNPDERPRDARVMLEQLTATQTLLQSALPSKTTGSQRTIVLPVKAQSGSDDQTQVLGSTARHRTGPIASDSTTALSLRSNKRRTRGWWLFAVVVVLAALAGGTGWYFGTGPGAKISIPIVSGQSITQATRALVAQGFVVNDAQQKASDPVIAKGLVVGTVPAAGTAVAKGGALTLVISQGPAMLAVPALVGLPEAEATATITTSKFTAGTPIQQFDSTVASGVVIDALDANGKTLVGRKTYGERQPITLVVSVGKLPAVSGMSLSDAQSALTAAKLTGVEGAHLYSSTIKQGQVIGIDQEKNAQGVARTFRVNDTVLLTISRGPELITVPNVVGMTWAQAKKILTDAHFVVSYNPAADAAPNFAIVKKTNPMGGKQAPKGSTITVTFLGG